MKRIRLPLGILTVYPLQGSPTLYIVESSTAVCSVCSRPYKRWRYGYDLQTGTHKIIPIKNRRIGSRCPYRGGCSGRLDLGWHHVDIATYEGHGGCSCEKFRFLEYELRKTPPRTWINGAYRCQHIDAARQFALDIGVIQHIRRQRRVYGHGQRELDSSND